jgi:triosephosphate isomerase
MIKKKGLVVGNWKMNPETIEEVKKIVAPIKRFSAKLKKTEVVLAPSFVHLPAVGKMIERSKKINLGAQNASDKNSGAHTGEVSSLALKHLGVKYVIVGHSERRATGETSFGVNSKIKTILANSLIPIVCIGEKERDRNGEYLEEIKKQIKETLSGLSAKDFMNIIITYEPVWAIGKSWREAMTGTDMHEMSLLIKKLLSEMFGGDYGKNTKILYGGSVEPENAEDLIKKGDIYGFLIGHASLDTEQFKEILKIVDAE